MTRETSFAGAVDNSHGYPGIPAISLLVIHRQNDEGQDTVDSQKLLFSAIIMAEQKRSLNDGIEIHQRTTEHLG